MKTDKFLKNLIKKLTKTPPRQPVYHYPKPLYQIIIFSLFLVLFFIYAVTSDTIRFRFSDTTLSKILVPDPKVEGFESDSFWCKYFSWFPGVSCDEPSADAPAAAASAAASAPKSGSSNSTSTPTSEEEESEEEESEEEESEPELPDCSCNLNCQLKNKSEDRVLDSECKVPEGIENVTNVNGYCDKCFDIVNDGCRLHKSSNPGNDPVMKADNWCGGRKVTGGGNLERCKATDSNNLVPGGAWRGMTFANAYPRVLVNYMIDSTDFSGEGGKCENNMDPKLKWTKYIAPHSPE